LQAAIRNPAPFVMSTILSISNATGNDGGSYTVLGGGISRNRLHSADRPNLAILLLNRGPHQYRSTLFREICSLGSAEVLSVEQSPASHNLESLSRQYANLKFLVFARKSTIGAQINTAIREASSEYIYALQGDMKANISVSFPKLTEILCTTPVFTDRQGKIIPTSIGPVIGTRRIFDTQPRIPEKNGTPSLIPWDYTGIYNKARHQSIGGFDSQIEESWWQKLDYGMRAWLWGEEIRTYLSLKISYLDELHMEDLSSGIGYLRFYLKNLAIRRDGDFASLPVRLIWSLLFSAGLSLRAVRGQIRELRHWMRVNRYRFKRDAAELTELWDWSD